MMTYDFLGYFGFDSLLGAFYGALDAGDGVGAQGLVHTYSAHFFFDYDSGIGGLVLLRFDDEMIPQLLAQLTERSAQ